MQVEQQLRDTQDVLLRLLRADDGGLDQLLIESASRQPERRSMQTDELRALLAHQLFTLEHYARLLRDRLGVPITGVAGIEQTLSVIDGDAGPSTSHADAPTEG